MQQKEHKHGRKVKLNSFMPNAAVKWMMMLMVSTLVINVSCSKNHVACPYDPCSFVVANAEVKQVEAYLATANITAVKHCSGMYYRVINAGTGVIPTGCSAVQVTYKGSLTNGKVFDQTVNPVSFSLIDLIMGWKNGLPMIAKGGKIQLFIPPSLGYGPSAYGDIPANSVLIFDIDLLDVR